MKDADTFDGYPIPAIKLHIGGYIHQYDMRQECWHITCPFGKRRSVEQHDWMMRWSKACDRAATASRRTMWR